jgi:hypothetical protein
LMLLASIVAMGHLYHARPIGARVRREDQDYRGCRK